MKKGFTLIELLAVIVILAIIALIATPIILGIINDAREKANERSVELYASAVRNAIASYQLTGTSAPTSFADLDIQYDGNVVCATEELYADGSFYIADCTVNGTEVDYTYGEQQVTQVYKPQYYLYGILYDSEVDTDLTAPSNPSSIPPIGKNLYLGYDVSGGLISTVYLCFVRNNTEYCVKGNDSEAFATNTEILKDAYNDVENACYSYETYTSCGEELDMEVYTDANGHTDASNSIYSCAVYSGYFSCD